MGYQELQLVNSEDLVVSAQKLEKDSLLTPEVIASLDRVSLPPIRFAPSQCQYIEIASTTFGVGKTTAAEVLKNLLTGYNVVHHPERWWDNPYLKNPQKRFQSELCFLKIKAEDIQRIQTYSPATVVLQETPPESDFLFAATDYALGTITAAEFSRYQQLYQALSSRMVKPDLIVLLYCGDLRNPLGSDFQKIFERIIRRDRGSFELAQGERIRAIDYLTKRFIREGGWGEIPILLVDTGAIDFAHDDDGKLRLAQMVVDKAQKGASAKFANLRVYDPGSNARGDPVEHEYVLV